MSNRTRSPLFFAAVVLYAAFIFQAALFVGPNKVQRAACNVTCAEFGAQGSVVTGAILFFQKRDAKCSCTIKDVQVIARDGTVVR